MPEILRPGAGLVFMKVGTHAQEPLSDIIERKRREIDNAGFALWGYGGNTCHPLSRVQPFARDYVKRDGVIYLCMQPMVSRHYAAPVRASQYSADGVEWQDIPESVNVMGSRYAMAIESLDSMEFDLSLSRTRVAAGRSEGLPGDQYITGRVDKGCLEVIDAASNEVGAPTVRIEYTARLVEPYAVLVR